MCMTAWAADGSFVAAKNVFTRPQDKKTIRFVRLHCEAPELVMKHKNYTNNRELPLCPTETKDE